MEINDTRISRFRQFIGLWVCLFWASQAIAGLPNGSWSISGEIQDLGEAGQRIVFTNKFSISGYYDNGRFLLDLTPIKTMDDVFESVGWDGKLLCSIQRWPNQPNKNEPRTNSIAYVEPSVFSKFASAAMQSVLSALADDNALTNLEAGKTPVILDKTRIFQEEKNTYIITNLSAGCIEIQAFSPGLQLGKTGLVPVPGFEQGFKRWTEKSNFRDVGMTNPPNHFDVEYDRFFPNKGRLLEVRKVTGEIFVHPEKKQGFIFRPVINEQSLKVLDYSSRYELLRWTEGTVDWCLEYKFTNQNWDFDTNFIRAQVAQVKTNLIANDGYPKDLLAKANTINAYRPTPSLGGRRVIMLFVMIVISALFAGNLWLKYRRVK